jgi:hypothetical protein
MKRHIIGIFSVIACFAMIYYYGFNSKKTDCHKPLPKWSVPADKIPHLRPTMDIYLGNDGIVRWNNVKINDDKFFELMKISYGLDPYPFVIFNYDKSIECDRLNFIRKRMEQSLGCAEGRCGEGTGWEHDDGMPDRSKK